jgi:hypothetical protein
MRGRRGDLAGPRLDIAGDQVDLDALGLERGDFGGGVGADDLGELDGGENPSVARERCSAAGPGSEPVARTAAGRLEADAGKLGDLELGVERLAHRVGDRPALGVGAADREVKEHSPIVGGEGLEPRGVLDR